MRILMLDNEFPPLGGGTGVVNYHLLSEWAKDPEIAVDLVTSSRDRRIGGTESFSARIAIHRVPVDNRNIHHATNAELFRYLWRGYRLSAALSRRNRYDLSFSFSGLPAGAISLLLETVRGLPYLVSLQGADIPGFEARYSRLYPLLQPILMGVWRRAGVVTAISEEHRALALRSAPNQEFVIVPNAVDSSRFSPAGIRPSAAKIRILCVGRLIERKGQHHLLRALARLARDERLDVELTLVGEGDARPSLEALADRLGVRAAARFAGCVSAEDMPDVYRKADVFVLPSQSEGMSIALLEAMASGLPVVVTQTGGTKELIDGNGTVVPWADVRALTRGLSSLIRDPAGRERMGRRSREIAERYAWDGFARRYEALCRRVAGLARCRVPGAVAGDGRMENDSIGEETRLNQVSPR
jgi:glycosyltransferase involved in cell wall biosynthesis